MIITDMLLTPGKEHGRTGQPLTPKGITVHYVGNPASTAAANRNWFEKGAGGAYSSAHYIIGLDGTILRLIPEGERAQHAGKSYGAVWNEIAKTNNSRYIGIECCHPDASGQFHQPVYAALVDLCADLCVRYRFNPDTDVVRHYDISGKNCPLYYVKNVEAWSKLRADIKHALRGASQPEKVKVRLNDSLYEILAENIGSHWHLTLPDLGGLKIKLADVLASAGYRVSWDRASDTVIGEK